MKTKFLITIALGLSASLGLAFDLPRGIHAMGDLAQAREKATERPELVSFVITKVSLRET